MRHLIIAAALAALLVGCQTDSRNIGSPDHPDYRETGRAQPAQTESERNARGDIGNTQRGPL
jgi:hypothetical protein